MQTKKAYNVSLYIFAVLCLLASFFNVGINFTSADSTSIVYSDVMSDLQKDEDFNIEDYPLVENDYSLDVIHIAESVNNELFVYVYQPSGKAVNLKATTIRISTAINENFNPVDYDLELLNSSGVFYKYKVTGLTIKQENLRYYQITAIHRSWNEECDEPLEVGGTINEVAYDVSQLWIALNIDDQVYYSCTVSKTIEITGKYAGHLRYANAELFNDSWTDAHFVAFSTDLKIDELLEANVGYVETYYQYVEGSLTHDGYLVVMDGPNDKSVTVKCDEMATLAPNYEWFPSSKTWSRIQTVGEFLEEENLNSVAEEEIKGLQYVLRFAETLRTNAYDGVASDVATNFYEISEITILRLKFQTDGITYNLGVVDNKQTGDNIPDNIFGGDKESVNWLLLFVITFVSLLVLIVLVIYAPQSFTWIFKLIGLIFKGLWWLITAPMELFK